MSMEIRGGVPVIRRVSAGATTAGILEVPPFSTNFLQVSNTGATNVLRIYFDQAAFDADAGGAGTDGFLELATSGSQGDYFAGPVELTRMFQKDPEGNTRGPIWLRGVGGTTTATIVFYQRRA